LPASTLAQCESILNNRQTQEHPLPFPPTTRAYQTLHSARDPNIHGHAVMIAKVSCAYKGHCDACEKVEITQSIAKVPMDAQHINDAAWIDSVEKGEEGAPPHEVRNRCLLFASFSARRCSFVRSFVRSVFPFHFALAASRNYQFPIPQFPPIRSIHSLRPALW